MGGATLTGQLILILSQLKGRSYLHHIARRSFRAQSVRSVFPTMHPLFYLSLLPLCLSLPHLPNPPPKFNGYLELRLKSAFPLNATVEIAEGIYFPTNKQVWNVPLVPDEVKILTNIPVKFHRPGIVLVNSGPVEKFGLKYVSVKSERWNTQEMTIAKKQMILPFTGFRLDIKCARNWHGPYCEHFCNSDYADTINRRCTHNGTLGCPFPRFGSDCEKHMLVDDHDCQCQNGGICVSEFVNPTDSVDHLICECPYGYEGNKCEKEQYDYSMPLEVIIYGKQSMIDEFHSNFIVDNELYTK